MCHYIIASEGWKAKEQMEDNELPQDTEICVTVDQLRGLNNCVLFVSPCYEDLLDAPRIRRVIEHYRDTQDVDVVNLI